VDLKEIKAIIDLMKKNSLSEFELEEKDFKIKLKRPIGAAAAAPMGTPVDDPELTAFASLARQSATPPQLPAPSSSTAGDAEIKSPMIGTFYRTPSPDAAPYVDIGSEVGPDTVVCIVEAMKVMNEIKAETRGIITAIVAENAKPVEFGQTLFKIRPL
jgi:acetyl-CoA carboxylase biotin carboxyl carrier protein